MKMADGIRNAWETDFQFEARKAFVNTHQQSYEADRLAALSNAWLNWKFYGCVYCKPISELLQRLESQLPEGLKSGVSKSLFRKLPQKIDFKKQSVEESTNFALVNGLIIYENRISDDDFSQQNSITVLNESAQKSRKTIEFQDLGCKLDEDKNQLHSTALLIDGKFITTGTAATKKQSKHDCADKAIEILRKTQPIVFKTSPNHENITKVEKNHLTQESYRNSKKIDDTNIGNKMLRKMGWTGDGGLGKGGLAEPVFVESAEGRKGFGHVNDSREIKQGTVEEVLMKFIREGTENEIKFSADLSKSDRALVHNLSQKFGLGHKSFGKGEGRYLVVTRRTQDSSLARTGHVGKINIRIRSQKPIWLS